MIFLSFSLSYSLCLSLSLSLSLPLPPPSLPLSPSLPPSLSLSLSPSLPLSLESKAELLTEWCYDMDHYWQEDQFQCNCCNIHISNFIKILFHSLTHSLCPYPHDHYVSTIHVSIYSTCHAHYMYGTCEEYNTVCTVHIEVLMFQIYNIVYSNGFYMYYMFIFLYSLYLFVLLIARYSTHYY